MGIYIHLNISKSVTQEEWEKVYEETLALMRLFPFAERRVKKIHNIATVCLVPTEEREEEYPRYSGKKRIGWRTNGDYHSITEGEDYYLPRNLVSSDTYKPDAGDALYSVAPLFLPLDWEEARFQQYYSLWNGKTQGEPYHIYLLAVGCLIADRLGEKAFLYGDITRGQCRRAVELVNDAVNLIKNSDAMQKESLKTPIDLPDQCDKERLFQRVSKLDFSEYEKAVFFDRLYLGTKDENYGTFFKTSFSEKTMDRYWTERFADSCFGTTRFHEIFRNYLIWGNELQQIFRYITFNAKKDYEEFVECVMNAKLHIKEKNCNDTLAIDPEDELPYNIWALLAQFAYDGARNPKVDRYIPIEQIRDALNNNIGNECNVDELIDAYLEKESQLKSLDMTKDISKEEFKAIAKEDPAEALNKIADMRLQKFNEEKECYDILDFKHLKFYEFNDIIPPSLEEAILECSEFLNQILLDEKNYTDTLMAKDAKTRCEWLVKNNHAIVIRDKDWDTIFTHIEENDSAFLRYYPLFRINLDSDELLHIVTGLLINDELYAYKKYLEDD